MASEHAYNPAPPSPRLPPPPPSPHPSHLQAPQISPRRFAVQPPFLNTTLAPPLPSGHAYLHGSQNTPATASSLSLPFSPSLTPSTYAPSPAVAASPMAMRGSGPTLPYNPQQWTRGGNASGQHIQHSQTSVPTRLQDVTGMEASMPSPPPPYSPGQNPNLSQSLSTSTTSSPQMSAGAFPHPPPPPPPPPPSSNPSSARPISGYHSRPGSMVIPSSATSITSNPQFPPPPPRNGTGRSVSRDKLTSKFSLSSFRNRNSDHSPGPSNIESLHISTSDAIQRAPASPGLVAQRATSNYIANTFVERRYSPETQSPIRPPTSRRAASAGVPGYETRTPIDESPIVPSGSWSRNVPLPPPPPGPPPSSSRSQSMGPGTEPTSSRVPTLPSAPPTRRPGQTTLTPIPPTPMGWQDEPANVRPKSPAAHGLHIDTSPRAVRPSEQPGPVSESGSVSVSSGPTTITSVSASSSNLQRTPHKRDTSTRGIRERRSESRAAREHRTEPSNNPWAQDLDTEAAKPANLDLGTPEGGLTRRGAVTRGTPRSNGALRSPRSGHLFDDPGSSNSTPRVDTPSRGAFMAAPTPPFSPGMEYLSRSAQKAPVSLPSKALPTPPLRTYTDERSTDLTRQSGAVNDTTIHTPNALHVAAQDSTVTTPRQSDTHNFARSAMERHRSFIEKEMAAETDQDRLELFAEFIVTESRLRRDRYSAAFDAMAGDIMDLTRDMWRSYGNSGRRSATPNTQVTPAGRSNRRSQGSVTGESPDTRFSNSMPTTAASPASSIGNFTPHTEPASPSSASSQKARDVPWTNNYHPSLSPIPSMAMSTIPDEQDSRGRSASRWWESDGGSSGVGGDRRLERSKRESKYMSLPKEARENLQWAGVDQNTPTQRGESSSRPAYGPNDYPPEKVGLHEESLQLPQQHPYGYYPRSATTTPDPHKLDVSRLVTLPPSYPRHHPAVNNSHPDLTTIRSSLRGLSELDEVKNTKAKFKAKIEARKEQENASLSDRRAQLRYNIQDNLRNGVMSFAEAAKAEADFESREHQRAQDVVQWIFDSFQAEVANPLHAMFCERITKATASMEHLKGRLSSEAQEPNPNQTQEEGDEKPELLEMLTLHKWLFEAREQLHKEMFELEDERNDLYRDIIVLPYVQTNNDQKVKEATTFFQRDGQDRKVAFEKETLKRYEDLMNVIEQNVTRGVEAQLSAFWDIAPGLLEIVQQVPQNLQGFEVLVPPQEYEETPAYHDYPLQYLYTLLAHAGRSAHQFIESQINLLCLLHEVKTGVMTAGSRLLETQRLMEGEDLAGVNQEMKAIRADEERRLTDDLKEKVGLVESQWNEALGQGLEDCKTRVENHLTEQGGWDDTLRE
ncbi:hypothetical protein CFE70_000094 [Pyrenophora teres f. teres 0-1]|uniref:Uncharacterized protein n=2 Tax=Pyrenophora teres f. teres TaxID=97479 RepID=E3S745_PYRTT|nr:hypothetical protein PTT_18611 [Pyrenophora teres f. teres 0-1]KAE8862201.1 hypothetical protein PTNB29_04763 [Pyrenophora teres f. teres]CAE6995482.1 CAP N multi-domain protein [Pyrenophora teres f. teres]